MGVLGYHVFNGPAGKVSVPIVGIGDGPGPPILRHRTARGTGQFALVERGDNRASGYSVYTHKGLFAIAKDARTELEHPVQLDRTETRWRDLGCSQFSWIVGTTHFNRVTRVEGYFDSVGVEVVCENWELLRAIWHGGSVKVWLHLQGPAGSWDTNAVSVSVGDSHPALAAWWSTGWRYSSGYVSANVSPGPYTVYLHMEICVTGEDFHPSKRANGAVSLSWWKEIAR